MKRWLVEILLIYGVPFGVGTLLYQAGTDVSVTIVVPLVLMFGAWLFLRRPWDTRKE